LECGSAAEDPADALDIKQTWHHDAFMRTTLSLDPDVAKALEAEQHRTRGSFKEVVNRALRAGLSLGAKPVVPLPPFEVKAKECGFRPGVDIARLNQLTDELGVEDFERAHAPRRSP
jgi:hypothetical protein